MLEGGRREVEGGRRKERVLGEGRWREGGERKEGGGRSAGGGREEGGRSVGGREGAARAHTTYPPTGRTCLIRKGSTLFTCLQYSSTYKLLSCKYGRNALLSPTTGGDVHQLTFHIASIRHLLCLSSHIPKNTLNCTHSEKHTTASGTHTHTHDSVNAHSVY